MASQNTMPPQAQSRQQGLADGLDLNRQHSGIFGCLRIGRVSARGPTPQALGLIDLRLGHPVTGRPTEEPSVSPNCHR